MLTYGDLISFHVLLMHFSYNKFPAKVLSYVNLRPLSWDHRNKGFSFLLLQEGEAR